MKEKEESIRRVHVWVERALEVVLELALITGLSSRLDCPCVVPTIILSVTEQCMERTLNLVAFSNRRDTHNGKNGPSVVG